MKRIAIIQGHPDPSPDRLGNALALAYQEGAAAAGHQVGRIVPAALEFPLLRTAEDWNRGTLPASLLEARRILGEADHVVILYPLWLGDMPAMLKGFLEQILRPAPGEQRPTVLKGKSARIVVTMGMPGCFYRIFYRAHRLRSLERNILGFVGVSPVKSTIFGMVEAAGDSKRKGWLDQMRDVGRRGA